MLRVDEHPVARARFPVIDFHGHLSRADPEQSIRVMRACNVRMIVDFDGGSGDRFERQKKRFEKHTGRFVHFARLQWRTIDDEDFSRKATRQLEVDVRAGARGLKISKALGLYVRDRNEKLIAVNDPRLDAVWAKCGELGIPVVIHTADPDAFFLPVDARNEQYQALVRKPNWSFHGKDFPTKDALLEQRNDIIARHSKTVFVGLHMANRTENLAEVAALLKKYPNLYVEFGARVNELGRQPYTSRKFFLDHQDRILFGLDRNPPRGLPKAAAAQKALRAINSEVEIRGVIEDVTWQNIDKLCQKCDLIVDGTDNFETRFLINDLAVKREIPWIYGACVGSYGVAFAFQPEISACLQCLFEHPTEVGTTETCDTAGILASVVHVIAAFQVAQGMKLLVGESPAQEILQIDVWTGIWQTIAATKARSSECRCCGQHQFRFLEGQENAQLTRLCGRNAVQICPPRPTRSDFQEISKRLDKSAQIDLNEFLMKIRVDGYEIALFSDGRSIIRGTNDFTEARAVYAKYIGN